jgi:hypothetical protein
MVGHPDLLVPGEDGGFGTGCAAGKEGDGDRRREGGVLTAFEIAHGPFSGERWRAM